MTVPVARSGFRTYLYGDRNRHRLPAYHRLDVSYEVDYGRGRLALGFYNAYNRLNPYYIEFETRYDPQAQTEKDGFRHVALFPILPSVSYRFGL